MTLQQDLARELQDNNSKINDFTIVCSDGGLVVASKAILAIRSPVCRKILFGTWNVVMGTFPMCFTSKVLQAVVEYCYTDTTSLWMASWNEEVSDELAATLVQLQVFARLFQMPELYLSTRASLEIRLASYPGCVCAVMKELMEWGWMRNSGQENLPAERVIDEKFWLDCMKRIEQKPFESLLPKTGCNAGMRGRPLAFLELVFRTLGVNLNPLAAVKVLREWRGGLLLFRDEFEKLKQLANRIELRFIPYADLWELNPCDLFPSHRLKIAMEYHLSELYAPPLRIHTIPQSPVDTSNTGGNQQSNSNTNQSSGEGQHSNTLSSGGIENSKNDQSSGEGQHSNNLPSGGIENSTKNNQSSDEGQHSNTPSSGEDQKNGNIPSSRETAKTPAHRLGKYTSNGTISRDRAYSMRVVKRIVSQARKLCEEQNSLVSTATAAADVAVPATATSSSDSPKASTREQKRRKVR